MTGLSLHGIVRQFAGAARPVLNGIDLEIAPGEFVALVGPSGAGKTTLLRIVAGLDRGFAGSVDWSAGQLGGKPPRLGMVFQEARLVPWLSLLDNLLLVADESARAEAIALLAAVELAGSENALPGQLSGGMQRRAALARALLAKPDLLLLDEPLISLDRACAMRMRGLLGRFWTTHRPTVLMVTHDMAEAAELASRIVALAPETGRIVLDRAISLPLPRQPGNAEIAAVLDALRDLARDWPAPAAAHEDETSPQRGAAAPPDYFGGTGALRSAG